MRAGTTRSGRLAVRRPRRPRPVLPRADRGLGVVHRPRPRRRRGHARAPTRRSPAPRGSPRPSRGRWPSPALTVVLALLLMVPTVVLVEPPAAPAADDGRAAHPHAPGAAADRAGRRGAQRAGVGAGLLPDTPLAEAFFALQEPSLPWILVFVYVILALPFVYRALDAGVRGADLAHADRGRPQPGGLVAAGAGLGGPAGAADVGAQRLVPDPRPGDGGVHDRRHPRLRDLPDVDRARSRDRSRSCRWPSPCSRC